jgi:hypothetical protein
MIDIEAIANRHLTSDKMDNKTFYEGHIVIDLHNAIEEIKRLREYRESCTENLLKGYETGKSEERAAVVAWLREQANSTTTDILRARDLDAADLIERGEHRKEKP